MTSTTHDSHESDHTTAESSNRQAPQGTPVLEVSDLNVSFPSEAGVLTCIRVAPWALWASRVRGSQ